MCNVGSFGDECKHSCSEHCIGTCHHVDGSCSCKEGYTGDTCDEGECHLKQLLSISTLLLRSTIELTIAVNSKT